ncbi:restriction endonuclease subunit S [Streptococcus sanguinis]|uniref:Type I restriction-modification system specificty subunit n=1 Tax=Streptococcus sanguinis TaxID=1305 RepID=A0A2X3VQG7_STRSA|nr:restriction endonuclease subunit S [Streptococcus sanguinis]EGQ18570.1 type I restriction-modification system [Streptococcus sanguinis ATCC 29667]EGQ25489.1 type I restriction-modification system [Streptococcus sanguinis SK340]SQF35697.1 type I restriction-modification system specificty subunit [Streptococcus sanguinis]
MKAILPKIKFKNFYEKWNIKKLQSIAPLRGGFAFKSEKFQNVGIPIVRISNIGFDGTVGGEFEYYSKLSPDEKFVLKGRSLLLAMSGATTGKIAMLDSEEEYYQNQRVGYFQNNGAVDYDFLSSVLQTKAFTNQLNAVLVAGAQPNISSKEIDSFEFCIPESIEEQSAIGSLFRTLDDLLASYKDNLANYQSLKATMLSKMFPKAGQTVPEIRLDGFEGEWEKLKLRDVVHTNPKSELPENFKYIDLESVVGTRINKIREERKTSAPSRAQRLAKKGDVFYQTVRPYQKNNYLFKLDEIDYVFSTGYAQLRPIFNRCDSDFLLILLQNNRFLSNVLDRCTGTSYPAINVNDLIEILIAIPSYEEQQAIGAYFSNLDSLISAHQEKISQLETLKKKLLQDMFI